MNVGAIWPKISVIVPCLNQGPFLKQALESVTLQHYPNLQLIVMDGGSADGSVDVIKSFEEHIDYWQSMPDGGQSSAINEGVRRAVGDLICWLNSDDLFLDNALWIVGKAASVHPNFGVYIGNGFRLDEKSQTRTPFTSRSLGFSRRALKHGLDYVQQASTFYLRKAWEEVDGLDRNLQFGLDWDLLIRIADKYPVVLINEFLSCSREYETTKTASGGLTRALELCEIGRRHTGQQVTVGALVYLLEALRGGPLDNQAERVRSVMAAAEHEARKDLANIAGHADGFPVSVDAGDVTFVPLVGSGPPMPPRIDDDLPLISIVTPSFNQAEFLPRTLASVAGQRYPRVEHIVMDGGSTDGSANIIEEASSQLAYWESEADRGPAHAISKGFQRAIGEILSWLNSDDMLADGALDLVGRAFRDHPEVDVVFANALYVDGGDKPILMDHGAYKTALYFGKVQPASRIPAYWSYVHAVPQPTVFFRKRILEKAGYLDEQYKCIFDFDLFFRFCTAGKLLKVERTLAFYRIHERAKTSEWYDFLVELYRFSRNRWPRWGSPQFRLTRNDFVKTFMNREWTNSRTTPMGKMLFWVARELLAAAVTIRLLNPEAMARSYRKWKSRRRHRSVRAQFAGND
jgi:glycosyltransferase involved in cell wall biosynthesis